MSRRLKSSVQVALARSVAAAKAAAAAELVDSRGRRIGQARGEYDFTRETNVAGGRKRRPARVETREEDEILRPRHRLGAANLTRDIVRNSPQARGMAKTMRINVVGSYGKLRFNQTGGWYAAAQRWFNSVWARRADYLDGASFREILQLVVYAVSHEGDFVAIFDDGILSGRRGGTGKLAFFESDQICNLSVRDFAPYQERGYSQCAGVIRDRYGRECGVICSRHRGQVETARAEALVLTRDPDAPFASVPWVHVRRKFRLRQGRGIGDAVTALQTVLDSYEMLGYEMQTAKMAASRYATVYEAEPAPADPKGFAELETEAEIAAAEDTPIAEETEEDAADALELYTGANVDYLNAGDRVEFDPTNRPNSQLEPFLDYTTDVAGQSHGLAHAYARMRADTSYTAFRGDMVMTWMCFADFQQFLEDSFSDWAAVQAIHYGVRGGAIDPAPEGWEEYIAWQYPTMPAVDEAKEQKALAQKQKNGLVLFREQIGPHWREHFRDLAEEITLARELGLPLSMFETKSGGVEDGPPENQTEE